MTDDLEEDIIHRDLDTDIENPAAAVAQVVADLEGKDVTDLSSMYECIDSVLENLFSEPPDPEAQMEIKFSYETYRITVYQDGTAEFVKTG